MARKPILPFVFALLAVLALADFDSSSSESCEGDGSSGSGEGGGRSGHHHHHHGGGNGGGNGGGGNDANRGCQTGWKRFTRPDGGWCMRVLPATGITYADSANGCVNQNAVLSGVQNPTEMTWIHEFASTNMNSNVGSLWIGLRRTAACLQQKLSPACSKTTSFYWTDGSTSGTAGFSWLDSSQPDNALGGNQNCVLMFFAQVNTTVSNVNWYPGALDDVNCDTTGANSLREVQGYVCGMRATR